jgi:rhamnulokinase
VTRGSACVAAVDFGASSIRVCRVDLEDDALPLDVVHRFAHGPVREADGGLRWRWDELLAELERGLDLATAAGPIASIGVCTWGVDYGLVDERGVLLSPPHSYRSERTAGFRHVVERIGERRLYEIAGVQLQPFNTIFQVAAHDRDELARARRLMLLPDLLVAHLTGEFATERTIAGTTGLLDIATQGWSDELIDATGARRSLFGELVDAPAPAGTWRGVPVHRVGAHDTASAVAATPDGPRTAFVSSGTWMLVGREQSVPDTSLHAQEANFTNELAVGGGIRFLKNVAGFWLLEACRASWGSPDIAVLLAEGATAEGAFAPFDTTDPRFLSPADMDAEIRSAGGIDPGAPRGLVVRAAIESIAETIAGVVRDLGGVGSLAVVGGAARPDHPLLVSLERHTAIPVVRGPVEATALGNALVQGVAIGRFTGLDEARAAAAGAAATFDNFVGGLG